MQWPLLAYETAGPEEDEDDEIDMEESLYQNRAAGRVRVGSRYVSDPNPTPPTALY